MSENLDTKLSRLEKTVSTMKSNLGLREDEVIEKVAEATNLHTLANIFIQEEEPEIKEGIWIQAESETHPYDIVKIDKDIIIPGAWRFDAQKTLTLNGSAIRFESDTWRYNFCIHDNKLYFVYKGALYEINRETGVMTKVRSLRSTYGMIHSGGGYLWFAGGNSTGIVDGFNLSTNQDITFTTGKTTSAMCYSAYDNSLYTYGNGICRYDLAAGTLFTNITSGHSYLGALIPMGSKILCLGSTDQWGVKNGYIDIDDGYAYTSVTNILDKQILDDYYNIPFIIGNLAYVVNCEYADPIKSIYTINLETLEYTNVTDQFASDMLERTMGLIYDATNNVFYIIDYVNSNSQYKLIVMENTTKQYENNMIIIMQSPITRSEKQTALWTYPCLDGRMCQSFFDVYYYNKETGIDFSLPMYYGNGNEWVKFKN